MVLDSRKGQFVVLSTAFLLLLLIFTYSLETQNSYITKPSKISILDNVLQETCIIGKMSNGSQIDGRYSNFTTDIFDYCLSYGYHCDLNITKKVSAPTNLSLLNYTHYDYHINYSNSNLSYVSSFTC